jgi:hypothetical protein
MKTKLWRSVGKILVVFVCALVSARASAQGTVNFSNQAVGVDAPFFDAQGVRLLGPGYVAELVYSDLPTGIPHETAAVRPFDYHTNHAGYFAGGPVSLPSLIPCDPAWVQVRAWRSADGATFKEAALAGAWTGVSDILLIPRTGGRCEDPPTAPATLMGLQYPGKPLVVEQPRSQSIPRGESATVSVVACTSVRGIYQWYQQPSEWANGLIPGATNSTYTSLPLLTNTTFWVKIANSAGSTNSDPATVTALPPGQGTVRFANKGPGIDTPFFGENRLRLQGPDFVAQLYYSESREGDFRPAAGTPVPFDEFGYFDGGTVGLPTVPGCGSAWLQVRVWDRRSGATFEEALSAGGWTVVSGALTGTVYWDVFIDPLGSSDPNGACITPYLTNLTYNGAARVLQQPRPQSIHLSETATLSVVASTGGQRSYKWYQQTTNQPTTLIVGATNATYTTPPLFTNTTFWVWVQGPVSGAPSDPAEVTVLPAAPSRLGMQATAGLPALSLDGTIGVSYRIQYSTNLSSTDWTTLAGFRLPTTRFLFSDPGASNSPARFYRAVAP